MKLFSVIRKDLLILVRSRAEMAVLFLMPLAFILPVSFALGAGDGYGINRHNQMILLPVVNYDGGPRAQDLMAAAGESLRLETSYEAGQLAALGLAEEEACKAVFETELTGEDIQTTSSPENPPAETASPSDAAAAAVSGSETAYPTPLVSEEASLTSEGTETSNPAVSTDQAGESAPTEPAGTAEATFSAGTAPAGTETASTPAPRPGDGGEAVLQSGPACNELAARSLLRRSSRTAVLIIPAGFSETIDRGEPAQVSLIYDPAGDSIRLQQIEGVIRGAAVKISLENQVGRGLNQLGDLVALAPSSVRQSWEEQRAQAQTEKRGPALSLKKVFPENYQFSNTPDTYQQTVPGYTVMYVFFIITSMAGSIRAEKLNGTFRRLLSAPVSRAELAAGKLIAAMLAGFVQVIFLFLTGAVVFKLGLGRDPLAFLILTGTLVAAAAALGMAVSTTSLKGAGLAAPLVIAALLGGCMFPIDLMPPFLRSLSYAVPHSWALNGYLNLMVRGQGLQEILPQIGALLGFALVFFLIAVWRFRFDD